MAAQQNKLNQLVSVSHPANHLLNVQLIHEQVPPNNSGYSSPKFQHWCFVSFAPGVDQGSGRTYDFQSNITQKFSLAEIAGLSFTLKEFAKNNGANVSPYSKFSRSQTGQKSLNVWQSIKDTGNNIKLRMVNITVTSGQTKLTVSLTPEQAYGFASNLNRLYKKAINLELERQLTEPKMSQQTANQQNTNTNTNTGFIQNPPPSDPNQMQNDFSQMASDNMSAPTETNFSSGDVPF